MLIKFITGIIVRKKIDRDPKVSESPRKIESIHQNDSIVATRACAVAAKMISKPRSHVTILVYRTRTTD